MRRTSWHFCPTRVMRRNGAGLVIWSGGVCVEGGCLSWPRGRQASRPLVLAIRDAEGVVWRSGGGRGRVIGWIEPV